MVITRCRMLRYYACTAFLVILLTVTLHTTITAEDAAPARLPVSPVVSVVMDKTPLTLDFTVTNNTDHNITTVEFGYMGNNIEYQIPSGKKYRDAECVENLPFITIDAHQSKTWRYDFAKYASSHNMREKGIYRISWRVNGVMSNEIVLRRDASETGK